MSIDTYVYFVSYEIFSTEFKTFTSNSEILWHKELKSIKDIREVENDIKELNKQMSIDEIRLINFQLLDSYNKEEREAVKE